MGDTNVSEEQLKNLQQNYDDLLSKHARALIAVDQLRVAKYLARPRSFQEKAMGTQMQTQTSENSVEAEKAVLELESQIDECIPLFAANEDPVGDLQQLLTGLQGDLAECLRNNNQTNTMLQNRVKECEDKIRSMEGALTLKILDSNSRSNSRVNSRASSRCNSRVSNRRSGAHSSLSNSSQFTRTTLPNTASVISGMGTENTGLSYPNLISSHYATSDFEQDEQLCAADSLTDIIEMHNDMRDSEGSIPDSETSAQKRSLWCIPRRTSSRNSSRKPNRSKSPQKSSPIAQPASKMPYKPLISPSKKAEKEQATKHKNVFSKPLSIKLKIFKKDSGQKYKKCISVITDGSVAGNDYELLPGERTASVSKSDGHRRPGSDSSNQQPMKLGKHRDNHHNSDSALGSSVTVTRRDSLNKNSKSTQQAPMTTSRSVQGSMQCSTSNMSIASSTRNMLYCTPILGPDTGSRASTPARGYDFAPSSYPNSECDGEIRDILNKNQHSPDYENLSKFSNDPTATVPVQPQPQRRQPLRAKRSRHARSSDKLPGYDSGFNEETSPKSSPLRNLVPESHIPTGLRSPRSTKSVHDYKTEISEVREGVQELADRLRDLKSSFNGSSRSSSPVLPPRTSHTRDALRERLRRLQCSSPASYDPTPRRSTSPRRSSSPHRTDDMMYTSSPRYPRSASPRYRSASPGFRSASPGLRNASPANSRAAGTPLLQYSRSPRPPERDYRDSRHLFYDTSKPEYGTSGGGPPGSVPIEVGVRVGGPATTNFDMGRPASPRTFPIDNFHTQSLQSIDQPYCVSPTSGMETHFHFNFYGNTSPTPDFSYPSNKSLTGILKLTEV